MKYLVYLKYILLFWTISLSTAYGQSLDPAGLDSLRKARKATKVIDLRPTSAFERGHIRFALSFPYENAQFKETFLAQFPAQIPLILYCQTGKVSQEAQTYLRGLGYKDVYILKEGFDQWALQSKPYVTQHPTTEPIAPITFHQLQQTAAAFPVVAVFLGGDPCLECTEQKNKIAKALPHLPLLAYQGFRVEGIREKLNTSGTPILLIFQRGKQVWRLDGPWNENDLSPLSTLFQP